MEENRVTPAFREVCAACRRPRSACLCPEAPPMRLRTRIVILMHPKEWRRERSGTGRLACLNIEDAGIIPGVGFDEDPRVRAIIDDPGNFPVLLYPSPGAIDLSVPDSARGLGRMAEGRRIVAFLVDATWSCSKAVLRESPRLRGLPTLMFTPSRPSRWTIKRQPGPLCLSTIETIHELLLALEAAGLEEYPEKDRLIDAFMRMQAIQTLGAESRRTPRFSPGRPAPRDAMHSPRRFDSGAIF